MQVTTAAPPTVQFTGAAPTENSGVRGLVSLNATASTSGGGSVNSVQFWVTDNDAGTSQCLATVTQAPFQCTWNTEATDSVGNRLYRDGDYCTIQAVAIQASRSCVSLDVTVDAADIPPATITQPAYDGAVISDSGDVSYQETGATSVGLWLFGSSEPFQLGSTAPPDGIYQLQAVACYSDGSMAYSPRTTVVVADNSTAVTSAGELGSVADQTPVFLINVPVVAGTSPAMGGAFYVEDPSRVSGIRVQSSTTIATGENVIVQGTLHNGGTGVIERYVDAQRIVDFGPAQSVPTALGIAAKWLGGQPPSGVVGVTAGPGAIGPYNVGLLVKAWGRVTYVDSSYIYIDDGCILSDGNTLRSAIIVPLDGAAVPTNWPTAKGLRVYCGGQPQADIGDYVILSGISSTRANGSEHRTVPAHAISKRD